jgi:hypothetical protein
MADMIKCPVCGESNPKEFEFCQYCQSRLQPLTGPLKGADAPIKPGSAPTKKSTADLEPILPQWLRDARSSARDASEGDLPQTPQQSKLSPRPSPSASSASQDLLAGLSAQSDDDDEETPDWLANITGGAPTSKKPKGESADVRWVELGGAKDSAPESETPSWMQELTPLEPQSGQQSGLNDWMREASGASQQPADESPDWLRQMAAGDGGKLFDDSTDTFTPADSSDTPDWLRQMRAADSNSQNDVTLPDLPANTFNAAPADESPDWLRSLGAADSSTQNNSAPDWLNSLDSQSKTVPDAPDWLSSLGAADSGVQGDDALFGNAAPDAPDWLRSLDANAGATSNVAPAQSSDTPDWLSSLGAADSGAQNDDAMFDSVAPTASDTPDWMRSLETPSAATSAQSSDTPDWLSSLGAADSVAQNNDAMFGSATPAASDTPDWLQGLGSETPSATPTPAVNDDWLKGAQGGASQPAQSDQLSEADMPSWLAGASTPASLPPAAEPQKDTESAALGDVPSWLKAAAPQSSIYDDLRAPQPAAPVAPSDSSSSGWTSAFKSLDPALPAQSEPAAAFTADSSGSADSLFTDMPDWLSGAVETPALSAAPETKPAEDTIEASQLPSWVQAMRPVDTGVAQIAATSGRSQTLEARGAFAGLQGALPAAPSYAPTSKPKTYSLKLQATGEQLSQAALLEQILAAETSPVPIASFSTLRTSNILRWSLAFIFFAMAFAVLSMRTQIFSLPVGVPFEIDTAIQAVQFIPEDAPVLVAFDYEPARVGEMEAVAGPLFDNLTLFHRPRLTFIATNENSSLLADRFMLTGPMAAHTKNGLQYLNLGYLPGGQMGIRAFAQNPRAAAPFDVTFAPAWDSVQLQDVKSFSQFAAFILVTDSSDAARVWIEQTTSVRGTVPIVVIASAQAAPMIQPYYASGQIKGLVSGLQGGAVFEQSNAGRPGTARAYWDAYSIGMLIAAALIVFGGLWNLFLSSRDRAAAREVK